ncbi:MAG: hypothetical protein EP329_21850 [Deltaproteobacteria bacterium]|nr:MAG: hypothetical protein EP329_21850 [Deltaproteobacteria bacterium]
MRPRLLVLALAATALVAAVSGAAAAAPSEDDSDIGSYGLDDTSRGVAPKGKLVCPDVPLTRYKGDVVRYKTPVQVYTGFVERLRRFETVAAEVATRLYGRPPQRILHMGTYNCRRISRYPDLVSEHGVGNGIDVAGFEFGPLPKGATAPDGLPKKLRRAFTVTVERDWDADPETTSHKARFLRELAETLAARQDIFRVLLGPGYPGHKNHFHFDCAPYRLVVL